MYERLKTFFSGLLLKKNDLNRDSHNSSDLFSANLFRFFFAQKLPTSLNTCAKYKIISHYLVNISTKDDQWL